MIGWKGRAEDEEEVQTRIGSYQDQGSCGFRGGMGTGKRDDRRPYEKESGRGGRSRRTFKMIRRTSERCQIEVGYLLIY